ncbi:hypothetical protein CYMTET_54020 [Cymbomonas tetramitiformis]|uniref:Uncharacterized protein n=1 Tax=Cymbomonas tetramitiformis TaxID=36881 RepID=A0AAE0BHK7_9CHLO|nr:hypothetical protein CYMTET_54020 [Cymbomonas tetramitiformis]
MDRRAMELLFSVAEASTTRLPRSEESQEVEHGALTAIPIGELAEVSCTPEPASEPAQGLLAEWVTRSSDYTRQVVQRLSHQDWEQRLRQMCSQGQKGTQGLGTANAVQRRMQWKLAPMEMKSYTARHQTLFSKAGVKPIEVNATPEWAPVERENEMRLPKLPDTVRLTAMMANVTQQEAFRETYPDIHEDELCLEWLKTGGAMTLSKEDYQRVRKRAARHRWDELTGELYMVTINGKELLAPKPGDRVLIMAEHYAPFIVCASIPNKEASTIASAFRNHVLSVFDSPEGNGLTERVVRSIKFCFKKMAFDKGLDYEWDELLWSLVFSYNAAKQQSTGVAPFTLLFAQEATVAPDLHRAK